MFEWISYIQSFYHDFLTAIDLYTDSNMDLITYTLGNQSFTLHEIIEGLATLLTSAYFVRLTYKVFAFVGKKIARKFGWS